MRTVSRGLAAAFWLGLEARRRGKPEEWGLETGERWLWRRYAGVLGPPVGSLGLCLRLLGQRRNCGGCLVFSQSHRPRPGLKKTEPIWITICLDRQGIPSSSTVVFFSKQPTVQISEKARRDVFNFDPFRKQKMFSILEVASGEAQTICVGTGCCNASHFCNKV